MAQVSMTPGSCIGKRTYLTKAEGKQALRKLLSFGKGSIKAKLTAYRCQNCGMIHIGHAKPWLHNKV